MQGGRKLRGAWGEPLEAAPECYLITFLMRKNEKTLRAKGWKLPISCKLFFPPLLFRIVLLF